MIAPRLKTWDIGIDKHGRLVTLTREGNDFTIRSEPVSQRDEGEIIRSLTRDILIIAGEIASGERS